MPYPNSGVLFTNNRKTTQNQPDYTGHADLDIELVKVLAAAAKAGQPIKIDLAGWIKTRQNGDTFVSLSLKPYRNGDRTAPVAQPQGAPPPRPQVVQPPRPVAPRPAQPRPQWNPPPTRNPFAGEAPNDYDQPPSDEDVPF